jgi:hypothetical protein
MTFRRPTILGVALALWASPLTAQSVTVIRNVNLRPDPSSEYAPLRLLDPSEPPLTLVDPALESGYYRVRTAAGEEGYVWSSNVLVTVAAAPSPQEVTVVRDVNLRPDTIPNQPATRLLTRSEPPLTLVDPTPVRGYYHVRTSTGAEGYAWSRNLRVSVAPAATAAAIQPGPGIPGSAAMVGCGDSLWEHVYHPSRLLVKADCVAVTGILVDATAHQSHHSPDGVRHERDGDTHGWLKVDSQFTNLINAGNDSAEDGNLVFELVCHYPVSQTDAEPACAAFADHTVIPPVGSHVAITGTFVQEKNHKKWNEIHPVSRIVVIQNH